MVDPEHPTIQYDPVEEIQGLAEVGDSLHKASARLVDMPHQRADQDFRLALLVARNQIKPFRQTQLFNNQHSLTDSLTALLRTNNAIAIRTMDLQAVHKGNDKIDLHPELDGHYIDEHATNRAITEEAEWLMAAIIDDGDTPIDQDFHGALRFRLTSPGRETFSAQEIVDVLCDEYLTNVNDLEKAAEGTAQVASWRANQAKSRERQQQLAKAAKGVAAIVAVAAFGALFRSRE
jgi:hypothetical protein